MFVCNSEKEIELKIHFLTSFNVFSDIQTTFWLKKISQDLFFFKTFFYKIIFILKKKFKQVLHFLSCVYVLSCPSVPELKADVAWRKWVEKPGISHNAWATISAIQLYYFRKGIREIGEVRLY